ncbi:MAG: DUF1538 domain-containing protein [Rhodobacteraceae bacterium]|nr:MAG: DUF1538 domain-containing protein [Paracoccaceae bacterium]
MAELVWREIWRTAADLAPIGLILGFFCMRFLRAEPGVARRTLIGALHLAAGLTLFRVGLEGALLPLGSDLAATLSARAAERGDALSFAAVVGFAVALGGAAALLEPTLAATADRVGELSGGAVRPTALRVAVAAGVGLGLGLGVVRLMLGVPAGFVLAAMAAALVALAMVAPRGIVPLALDSGAIATSVVTVPVIVAYGVALTEALPDRSALADGFGLIVLAMIGASLSVLTLASIEARLERPAARDDTPEEEGP